MAHVSTSNRTRSARTPSSPFQSADIRRVQPQPVLVTCTDICLWFTIVAVVICFGGRAAIGQAALVIGAAATSLCWLVHLFTSRDSRYVWTGSEWLWGAGIIVGVCQIVPLPEAWQRVISPRTFDILPLWSDRSAVGFISRGWHQLSLAPWETASGIATFVAYSLLFVVAAQRIQTVTNVESTMSGVALIAVAMSVFALSQCAFSNGKFFWFIHHPFMTTDYTPHGSFTNHNHLSQFLVMGVAPLILWFLDPLSNSASSSPSQFQFGFRAVSLLTGLALLYLTVLLTASRGGLLALAITSLISMTLYCRIGLASIRYFIGLCCASCLTAGIFFITGYETLAGRVEVVAEAGAKASNRLEIWRANLDVAHDFPLFGTGVGTHQDAHQLRLDIVNTDGIEFTHAESGYLQVASECGFAGLIVMVLMIAICIRWCVIANRNSNVRIRGSASAVISSLLANLVHAAGDFFWYTPACMLLLLIQLVCACRLAALTRNESGRPTFSISMPRPLSVLVGCGLAAAALWMVNQKIPAALAEPDYMRFLTIAHQELPQEEDERLELEEQGRDAIIRAARLVPHDSRMQESAALAYMEMFDARQVLDSETGMSHAEIRDAVVDADFKSYNELQEWLHRAFGRNLQLLQLSRRYFMRAIQASPLRADSYINLVEIGFMTQVTRETATKYLQQALTLRPKDPQVQFAVGKHELLANDLTGALVYWRAAYRRSPKLREKITNLLVPHVTAEFFLERFTPDWIVLRSLAFAFEAAGRPDEARIIWLKCIENGTVHLKAKLSEADRQVTSLILRDAYFAIERPDRAIQILTDVQKQSPYNIAIRTRLGWDLYEAKRYGEAAAHLRWCAARTPNDTALQQAASIAVKERLKAIASTKSRDPN